MTLASTPPAARLPQVVTTLCRRRIAATTLGVLGALALALWGSVAVDDLAPLPPEPVWRQPLPPAHPPADLRFAVIRTGHSRGALEATLVTGGSWFTWRQPVQAAVLVRHPRGTFLFDTGLGRHVDQQFAVNSWLDRQFFAYQLDAPAADQLQAAGWLPGRIDFIVPSHLHWDHVGGLVDFPDAPVRVQAAEREGAEHGHAPGFLRSQFEPVRHWQALAFDSGPWLGFERSQDLFGDGSAVLVPLGGHTAGQVGLVLSLPSGRRLLFTGDVSWTIEGLRWPADRSWLLRRLTQVDADVAANQRTLQRLHQLMLAHPELELVPAHDEHVMATLPRFPDLSP